jgi:hypothetical protein
VFGDNGNLFPFLSQKFGLPIGKQAENSWYLPESKDQSQFGAAGEQD